MISIIGLHFNLCENYLTEYGVYEWSVKYRKVRESINGLNEKQNARAFGGRTDIHNY